MSEFFNRLIILLFGDSDKGQFVVTFDSPQAQQEMFERMEKTNVSIVVTFIL